MAWGRIHISTVTAKGMILMSLFNQGEKAYLMLADGQVFEGRSFGAKGTVIGEVVFTTGLTGYQETLTDPSYYGQIVTQTFPLIGNYGVNSQDSESAKSYVSGYIVREWCNAPSNFRCEGNINDFLTEHNIIGIHNIDTRRLTRIIREVGVMNGVITTEDVYAKKDELLEKIRAHLKHHPLDDKRVALPGASIFAHLSVVGVIWNDIYIYIYISRPQPKE